MIDLCLLAGTGGGTPTPRSGSRGGSRSILDSRGSTAGDVEFVEPPRRGYMSALYFDDLMQPVYSGGDIRSQEDSISRGAGSAGGGGGKRQLSPKQIRVMVSGGNPIGNPMVRV